MVKRTEDVVEAEFTEVEEAQEEKREAIECLVSVGITEEGNMFFNISRSKQSLVTVDGLLKYAERHMENVWKDRFETKGE